MATYQHVIAEAIGAEIGSNTWGSVPIEAPRWSEWRFGCSDSGRFSVRSRDPPGSFHRVRRRAQHRCAPGDPLCLDRLGPTSTGSSTDCSSGFRSSGSTP
jgi:hypothetical protein